MQIWPLSKRHDPQRLDSPQVYRLLGRLACDTQRSQG